MDNLAQKPEIIKIVTAKLFMAWLLMKDLYGMAFNERPVWHGL